MGKKSQVLENQKDLKEVRITDYAQIRTKQLSETGDECMSEAKKRETRMVRQE